MHFFKKWPTFISVIRLMYKNLDFIPTRFKGFLINGGLISEKLNHLQHGLLALVYI